MQVTSITTCASARQSSAQVVQARAQAKQASMHYWRGVMVADGWGCAYNMACMCRRMGHSSKSRGTGNQRSKATLPRKYMQYFLGSVGGDHSRSLAYAMLAALSMSTLLAL